MEQKVLALYEFASKQKFIYKTSKIKEISGASKLLSNLFEEFIKLTKELTEQLRKNRTIDWNHKDSARAKMRVMIKRLLKKYHYPPEGQEQALRTVMAQCNKWADDEGNIYDDEEDQLEQLIDAIEDGDITEENFDDYLQLWAPEILSDDTGAHKTVSLTVYDDGSRSFKCFAPGMYFEVYEC